MKKLHNEQFIERKEIEEKIIKVEQHVETFEKNKQAIVFMESKVRDYEEINNLNRKFKNKIMELSTENSRLKEEATQEAVLLLHHKFTELEDIEDTIDKKYVKDEYNLLLHVKGFTELEQKLKVIISLNRKLLKENAQLKIGMEKIKEKYKDIYKEKEEKVNFFFKKESFVFHIG